MPDLTSLVAPFLFLLAGFFAGILGAALTKWTLVRFLRELEYRVADLEERVNREVKVRAGIKSREKAETVDDWLKSDPLAQPAQPSTVQAPPFKDWYKKKMTS
jgi:hypothetical protein